MTKLEFLDKINDILIGLNTAESDALGSLYDELMNSQWIPVEKTNTINVFFRKEQDGWHTYTQYGIDLPTRTAVEFGEHIAKAVNLLNGEG